MGIGAGAVEREADLRDGDTSSATGQERLGGASANFASNLGRRAAELGAALQRLAEQPRSHRLLEDFRRRVHALSTGARLLRFVRLVSALGEIEARIDRVASQGMLAPEDGAMIHKTLETLPSLAWSQSNKSLIVARATPSVPNRLSHEVTLDTPPTMPPLDLELEWEAPRASALSSGPSEGPDAADTLLVAEAPKAPEEPAVDADRGVANAVDALPITVLIVGPASVAAALSDEDIEARFDVERTDEGTIAIDRARSTAPDLVVVDADMDGARELVEALVADPLTETVPVLVLGRWSKPADAAPYVALGVARALPKPVSPGVLRRACTEAAATYVRPETRREPLGKMTLDQLGARLADELRRGLYDCASSAKARGIPIEFGDGSDVLAALWGAVARIRDVATIRSQGQVRFDPSGPEGALPFAPWLGGRESEAGHSRVRPSSGEVRLTASSRLDGMVIVVADDDPAVTWFLADVLGAAGAAVHEAHDGAKALELAYQVAPDLILSDVLMPELDGFGLCRMLKRDVALRDVPVILLSWKEDLLQRVRELGAEADGYLQKQASAGAIIQRVREVMAPKRRVSQRLEAGGEVKGRLDGLTIRSLLSMVCVVRPTSTLSVRDASFLYEVEIRDGRPVRATRTATDGTFERGPRVIAALIGIGAGRFVVSPVQSLDGRVLSIRADLTGNLGDQLLPAVAFARAAQRLLSGETLMGVERVELSADSLSACADITPEPVRALLRRFTGGTPPRTIVASGQASARFVEDVLCDAAARGAITAILGSQGDDLLPAAVAREIDTLRGVSRPEAAPPPLHVHGLEELTGAPAAALAACEGAALIETPGSIVDIDFLAEDEPEPCNTPVATAFVGTEVKPSIEPLEPSRVVGPLLTLGSLSPPPVLTASKTHRLAEDTPGPRHIRGPSSYAPGIAASPVPVTAPPSGTRPAMWLLFAAAGILFAVGARMSRERAVSPPPLLHATPVAVEVSAPPVSSPSAEITPVVPAALPADRPVGESAENPMLPQDLPLRSDDKVPAGQGMLEIVAGTSDTIYIDHRLMGNGPLLKLPLEPKAGAYEVRVKLRGEERVRFAVVKEGRLTRLRVAPPWTR